jgi:asparagine synthase (glutamine-hydrolysing)
MCGIAGMVSWDARYRITRPILARMSACIAHRGPDAQGAYLNHDESITPLRPQVGLVHRRLAILDLDRRANQPFTDVEGRWIVFNGEIYNFLSLRQDLSRLRPDYQWRTTCDTEVLLLAYDVWQDRCVEYLNGMYAFAIWDGPRQSLLLARDRMGQKPLYYAAILPDGSPLATDGSNRAAPARPAAIAFASELPALHALPFVDGSTSREALTDYLCWGYIPAPRTIYRGVCKLPRAHTLQITPQSLNLRRFRNPGTFDPSADPVEQTRTLVINAVRRQLVSDVPLGCFLSGGVDSSIIAAAMKAAVAPGQPVLTFAIGFDDPRYDETPHAAAVARRLGTEHRQFIVQPHAVEDLPRLAATFGEPFADSSALPTHYLSRETRRHVTVALSGDGGDELFGGYDRYRAMRLGNRLRIIPPPLRYVMAMRLWRAMLPGWHPKSHLARLKRLLSSIDLPPAQRYASYMRLFDDRMLHGLLLPDDATTLDASAAWLADRYQSYRSQRGPVEAALAADRATYLPEDLFVKVDRCSMLHALEVRSPFMDPDLVDFAANLPTRLLLHGRRGKMLLRRAFARDLPEQVFARPKMGFALPIGQWFRTDLKSMLHDTLLAGHSFAASHFDMPMVQQLLDEHDRRRRDHSERLYALLMLELWHAQARAAAAPAHRAPAAI